MMTVVVLVGQLSAGAIVAHAKEVDLKIQDLTARRSKSRQLERNAAILQLRCQLKKQLQPGAVHVRHLIHAQDHPRVGGGDLAGGDSNQTVAPFADEGTVRLDHVDRSAFLLLYIQCATRRD